MAADVFGVASQAVRQEAAAGRVRWLERRYQPGDAEGQFFVMVATDDPETNAAIFADVPAFVQGLAFAVSLR